MRANDLPGNNYYSQPPRKKNRKRPAVVNKKMVVSGNNIEKYARSKDSYFVPYRGGYATLGWIRNDIDRRENSPDEQFRRRMGL